MLHPILNKTPTDVWQGNFHVETGDVGVELEIEGKSLVVEDVPGWIAKEDHSLRGEAREYVTRGAVPFGKLSKSLNTLFTAFENNKSEIIPSDRCSTHFHINMQNETFRTYFGTVFVFTILEPLLLRICGPKRNGNLFCMPSYETGDLPFIMAGQAQCLKRKYVEWFRRGKYASLCLDNMPTFGSVEVRIFPISSDKNEIMKWATWCFRIKELAKNWKDETYLTLGHNPEALAYQVFPEVNLHNICQPEPVSQLLDLGCETAYEAWRGAETVFHYNKDDDEKKAKILAQKHALPEEVVMQEWDLDQPDGDF